MPLLGLHLVEAVDGVIAEHPVCSERAAKRMPVGHAAGFQLVCTLCLAVSLTMMERR